MTDRELPHGEERLHAPRCPRCDRPVLPRQTQLERGGMAWHWGCERDQRIHDRKQYGLIDVPPEPKLLDPDPSSYPKLDDIAAAVKNLQATQRPDDIVACYMAQSTFDGVAKRVGRGQSLRSYLGATFGVPVHIDDELPYGALDGVQRDGTRRPVHRSNR